MKRRPLASFSPKLLCVDDDSGARRFCRTLLESNGYQVLLAADAVEALQVLRTHRVVAVVSDYEMPGMNGVDLATVIKRRWRQIPFVLLSGHKSVIENPPGCVDAAVPKGSSVENLLRVIERIRRRPERRSHIANLRPLVPLGEALASVAVAAFVLPRILK